MIRSEWPPSSKKLSFTRQLGAIGIASAKLHATDVKLAGHSHRQRVHLPVENVDLRVGHRPADRHHAATRLASPGRHVHRRCRQRDFSTALCSAGLTGQASLYLYSCRLLFIRSDFWIDTSINLHVRNRSFHTGAYGKSTCKKTPVQLRKNAPIWSKVQLGILCETRSRRKKGREPKLPACVFNSRWRTGYWRRRKNFLPSAGTV